MAQIITTFSLFLCVIFIVGLDSINVAIYQLLGKKPMSMSLLFFLQYTSCAGGIEPLVDTKESCAQEFKIKVSLCITKGLLLYFITFR